MKDSNRARDGEMKEGRLQREKTRVTRSQSWRGEYRSAHWGAGEPLGREEAPGGLQRLNHHRRGRQEAIPLLHSSLSAPPNALPVPVLELRPRDEEIRVGSKEQPWRCRTQNL